MGNLHVASRLDGIHKSLLASHAAGKDMSSASKGTERELFITDFLTRVFPPHFRFGSGDITDRNELRTGQVDIVVESPFLFSLPAQSDGPRLFLAESVAAVIEVKSDLRMQWKEVERTVTNVRAITRRFRKEHLEEVAGRTNRAMDAAMGRGHIDRFTASFSEQAESWRREAEELPDVLPQIPVYVIGFEGWKTPKTVDSKRKALDLDGLLVLNPLIGSFTLRLVAGHPNVTGHVMHEGTDALWFLLERLKKHVEETAHQTSAFHSYHEAAKSRQDRATDTQGS